MTEIDPRVQALYAQIMKVATGPLSDQKITLYATCDPGFAVHLPPLPQPERLLVMAQIERPFVVNPKATDRVLCNMAVQSWARKAARDALPLIRADLEREYWHGDPETLPVSKPVPQSDENILGRLARRLHLR